MNKPFNVIVIGIGAMGSAACFHLARRGGRVLGLEQFDIPHMLGSSGGFSRMIRLAYYEHPDYVPLLRRAYELWHEIEQVSGRKLLHITGGLYIGPPENELVSGSLHSAREHSLDHEQLDRSAIAKRYPPFQLPEDHVALFEPMAGFLLPEKCIDAHVEGALRHGAEIHAHESVQSWTSDARGASVTTDRATYRAEKLIFCGGAWSGKLLHDLDVKLLVTRQTMLWTWPAEPEIFKLGRFPVWAIGQPDGSLFYGFPMHDDGLGLKAAYHARGEVVDPDQLKRDPAPEDARDVREALAKYLPRGLGPTLALRVCMYTNSPDSHFIIDRHPNHERVTLACGFSGHGFKFASVIGEALADLAMQGTTSLPIGFLGLSRFLWRAPAR